MIVISSRRRPATSSGQQGRKYNAVRYRREMRDSSLTRRDPTATAIKPFGIGNIQLPTSQDDASLESRLLPQTSSTTTHLERDAIFLTDSQGSSESSSQGVMLDPHEKTPLLHSEQRSGNSSESELNVGLGTLPSAGVWARDTSGTQLTRFVVLLIFLLFSCLIVSIVCAESGIINLYWGSVILCTILCACGRGDDIDLAQYALLRYTALQKTTGYTRPFMRKLNFVISVTMAIPFSETQHFLELGFFQLFWNSLYFHNPRKQSADPLHVYSVVRTEQEAYSPPGLWDVSHVSVK